MIYKVILPPAIILQVRGAIEAAFSELLSTKHLYQSVRIDIDSLRSGIETSKAPSSSLKGSASGLRGIPIPSDEMERIHQNHRNVLQRTLRALLQNNWKLVAEDLRGIPLRSNHPEIVEGEPVCFLPVICRGCCHCKAVLPPHNPSYFGSQHLEPLLEVTLPRKGQLATTQFWSIAYQCQACRGEPVIFSIRREGEKLQLVGRSLFDRVSIPEYFPESLHRFYSETQIARTAGKPLPSCLYLRLLIEHHMRSVSGITERVTGDELADAYSERLSSEFPRSEVSLKEVYATLSTLIHDGTDDPDTLNNMVKKVDRHFQLLALIPIPTIKNR